ncbi:MAG TPA: ABC transporter permease [Gemmatimonadales bacterium]|nr:ABC transporter permease [Gemmatimonadales bacterium]
MRTALPRRLAIAALTIVLVVTATFAALHVMPGDPVRLLLGPAADPATVTAARHALGLDRPLPVQYLEWLARFASGRWGTSIAQQRPVAAVLGDALGPTLLLVGASLLLTYLGGVLVGAWQAARRASRADAAVTAATTVLYALPSYVVALALVAVFAYGAALWRWPAPLRLPAFGAAGLGADLLGPAARLADRVRHLVLPVATLALVGIAGTARYVRGAMVDALRQPFVRAARARGLSESRVLLRHVLRTALVPVVTLFGLQLPALFSGVVFVESIFAWPGMGRVTVQAVLARDYPVVMASTAVFAVLVVAGNLLADAVAALADPRRERPA